MTVTYISGAELGDLEVTWTDSDGAVIDFSTGHTFAVKVGPDVQHVAEFTKTTGITGAATAPNVTIAWVEGDLGSLAAGDYIVQIEATRTSDSKQRIMQTSIRIDPALG